MRWDDLQLLRLIDEAEASEQLGSLMTGYTFMQAASGERPIDWERDGKSFARELLIARDAGYLEWIEMSRLGAAKADPLMESQRWAPKSRLGSRVLTLRRVAACSNFETTLRCPGGAS